MAKEKQDDAAGDLDALFIISKKAFGWSGSPVEVELAWRARSELTKEIAQRMATDSDYNKAILAEMEERWGRPNPQENEIV